MRLSLIATTCVLAGLAGPLTAQCVTSADLSRGVTVQFENGDFTVSQRRDGGYLEVTEYYNNGDNPIQFRAHRGIYFVQEFEIDSQGNPVPGTLLDIEFQTDPSRLPDPTPGVYWEGPTVNIFEGGGTRDEITSVRYSDMPDVTLSGCTYDAVRADLRYDWGPDGGLSLAYVYLPEVGTAYILSNQFDGSDLNTTTAVSIGLRSK
jgi:hypothetical protein